MDNEDIIRMAREAGFQDFAIGVRQENLERFAALVAAHESEQLKTPHECQTEGEKTAFAFGWFKATEQIEAAVLAEREACAKVCEWLIGWNETERKAVEICAAAIRARSEK